MRPFAVPLEPLQTIPGIGCSGAEVIIAETGADMSRFRTAGHLASWAGTVPGRNESAGKTTLDPDRRLAHAHRQRPLRRPRRGLLRTAQPRPRRTPGHRPTAPPGLRGGTHRSRLTPATATDRPGSHQPPNRNPVTPGRIPASPSFSDQSSSPGTYRATRRRPGCSTGPSSPRSCPARHPAGSADGESHTSRRQPCSPGAVGRRLREKWPLMKEDPVR
ncbi:MAG: IS110 family transposase [Catenulisporales bacterium]|nr:IS110 family transposase [Catenulisporales bacterium]